MNTSLCLESSGSICIVALNLDIFPKLQYSFKNQNGVSAYLKSQYTYIFILSIIHINEKVCSCIGTKVCLHIQFHNFCSMEFESIDILDDITSFSPRNTLESEVNFIRRI